MTARCNHVFLTTVGGGCKCGATMPPAHRVERDNDQGGIDVEIVCTQCCPEHRTREPLEDRATIETIAGEQDSLW